MWRPFFFGLCLPFWQNWKPLLKFLDPPLYPLEFLWSEVWKGFANNNIETTHFASYSVCLNYIWEWSIHYSSFSAMFIPLHSSTNQELFKKYVYNQSSHYEKYNSAACPSYHLKLKYPLPFSVSYVRLVTQQYESRSLKSISVIKVAPVKSMNDFSLCKGSHHM